MSKKYTLNIVLVEPQIPQNTGNIARTCAVTGARLHIVKPLGFEINDAKLKRAGLDYWSLLDITYYENLGDFLDKAEGACFYFETKSPRAHSEVIYPDDVYIIFGREDKGLSEDLLRGNLENCVRIPMIGDSGARSLNLSNSVAVGVYEVLRQWGYPKLQKAGKLSV
ncbi:MAG: tRNA (cytidine(34)-2'-O)-methyltransferase [Oscillospiraceae bacterium]|jgi:tRNA (cytidine/uridine-2'-O-)-methyltransferase|nr:tRNA (cytidine(34)-2'-O)-methyltransferase [Oscillospiraceae bacterium]